MECGFYVYKGLLCEICSSNGTFSVKEWVRKFNRGDR